MPLVPEDHVVDEAWGHVPPPPPDEEDEYDARRAARPPHKGAKTHRAGDLEEVEETYEAPAPKAKRSRKERPPDAPLVVDGKGSEHPQLNIRKNISAQINRVNLKHMIDTGRLSLSHAIQSLRPAGPQRKKWKCDENPELASQLDGLLRFVVAWKKDLVPGWQPEFPAAAKRPKLAGPPVLAAGGEDAACAACGRNVAPSEKRVVVALGGGKEAATFKVACFAGASTTGGAPPLRIAAGDGATTCRATGAKIDADALKVSVAVDKKKQVGKKEQIETVAYAGAAASACLEAVAARAAFDPSKVPGFDALTSNQKRAFYNLVPSVPMPEKYMSRGELLERAAAADLERMPGSDVDDSLPRRSGTRAPGWREAIGMPEDNGVECKPKMQ